jgi:protein-tyrosine phosphatase
MIDIHSHVLPLVDDGAQSWEAAITMCQMSHADGVTHLVATPHANFVYDYDRQAHLERLAELQQHVPELKLILGCDMHLDHFEDVLQEPQRFTIGETHYLLVEVSDFMSPRVLMDAIYRLHCEGIRTIVTHPERVPTLSRKFDALRQLADMGSVLQVTANSITGFWGRPAQSSAERMIAEGLARIVASDAHDVQRRTPVLSQARAAVEQLIGDKAAKLLFNDYPAMVIADQVIE